MVEGVDFAVAYEHETTTDCLVYLRILYLDNSNEGTKGVCQEPVELPPVFLL